MNTALHAQQEAIGALKERERSIDEARHQVADLRHVLETARQSSPPKPAQEMAVLEQEYLDASQRALEGILRNIAGAHREFAEREVEALKSIG
ncbi:hypothetical protein [Streptomyces xanthophaeus]|uniref:hypothetical protein n=1 Tax=Streptomyces xanthophaeus TaxID=67385 RepID=UPI0036462110